MDAGLFAFQWFLKKTQLNISWLLRKKKLQTSLNTQLNRETAQKFTRKKQDVSELDLKYITQEETQSTNASFVSRHAIKVHYHTHTHTCDCPSVCLLSEVKRLLSVFLTDCRGPLSGGERETCRGRCSGWRSINYTNEAFERLKASGENKSVCKWRFFVFFLRERERERDCDKPNRTPYCCCLDTISPGGCCCVW